jgi:bis(5'-nucleosidyl)-tetraphosphatase
MHQIKSCGVLVFRREPELSFLLMKHPHRYDLPKGHVEAGESEIECALRELSEETGIPRDVVQLEEGFRYVDKYYPKYRRFGNERVEKTLVIFLGWLLVPRPIVVSEHASHVWLPWNPPHRLQRETVDSLLQQAGEFFQARSLLGTNASA